MAVRVTQLFVSGFDDNFSYLIHDEETTQGYVVDPSGSFDRVTHAVATLGVEVVGIILTHTHPDHHDALATALVAYAVPVYVEASGIGRISAPAVQPLHENDTLPLGEKSLAVMHTPGHTSDSICLYLPAQATVPPQLIAGDTLFINGCGRTAPAAIETMYQSLQRLRALPAETLIYPGHDYGPTPTATIGAQRTSNPYLSATDLVTFRERRLAS